MTTRPLRALVVALGLALTSACVLLARIDEHTRADDDDEGPDASADVHEDVRTADAGTDVSVQGFTCPPGASMCDGFDDLSVAFPDPQRWQGEYELHARVERAAGEGFESVGALRGAVDADAPTDAGNTAFIYRLMTDGSALAEVNVEYRVKVVSLPVGASVAPASITRSEAHVLAHAFRAVDGGVKVAMELVHGDGGVELALFPRPFSIGEWHRVEVRAIFTRDDAGGGVAALGAASYAVDGVDGGRAPLGLVGRGPVVSLGAPAGTPGVEVLIDNVVVTGKPP